MGGCGLPYDYVRGVCGFVCGGVGLGQMHPLG